MVAASSAAAWSSCARGPRSCAALQGLLLPFPPMVHWPHPLGAGSHGRNAPQPASAVADLSSLDGNSLVDVSGQQLLPACACVDTSEGRAQRKRSVKGGPSAHPPPPLAAPCSGRERARGAAATLLHHAAIGLEPSYLAPLVLATCVVHSMHRATQPTRRRSGGRSGEARAGETPALGSSATCGHTNCNRMLLYFRKKR